MHLDQILAERERRWNRRQSLAVEHGCPVLSLTLNIPGPEKNPPGAKAALDILRVALRVAIDAAGGRTAAELRLSGPDGPGWLAAVRMDSLALKRLAVGVEEQHALGRLADADVMAADGRPINREDVGRAPRRCFLCSRPASLCRRERRHGLGELLAVVRTMLSMTCPERTPDVQPDERAEEPADAPAGKDMASCRR